MSGVWVIKLGGSFFGAPDLAAWLDALATPLAGSPAIVVVPGGGPFADGVRRAQRERGFSDLAAHRMAILAMDQYAWMLADLEPRLSPAASLRELAQAGSLGRSAIWLPSRLALAAPELAPSWSVTSDSLAAWLAGRLAANAVIFVKSAPLPAGPAPLAPLIAAGVLDPALPQQLAGFGGDIHCLSQGDQAQLIAGRQCGRPPGIRVCPGAAA